MTYNKTAILIHQTHRSLDIKKWINLGKWIEHHNLKYILHFDRNWLFTAGVGYMHTNMLLDQFDTLVMISGRTGYNTDKIEQLLEDLRKMRNDMVARNYPFQQLSNLILKYEMLLDEQKTPSEKLQDDLEPIE